MSGVIQASWEERGVPSLEQSRLQKFHGGEVGQRIGQHGLADEYEIDDQFEARGLEIVGDDFQRAESPGEEAHIAGNSAIEIRIQAKLSLM